MSREGSALPAARGQEQPRWPMCPPGRTEPVRLDASHPFLGLREGAGLREGEKPQTLVWSEGGKRGEIQRANSCIPWEAFAK